MELEVRSREAPIRRLFKLSFNVILIFLASLLQPEKHVFINASLKFEGQLSPLGVNFWVIKAYQGIYFGSSSETAKGTRNQKHKF